VILLDTQNSKISLSKITCDLSLSYSLPLSAKQSSLTRLPSREGADAPSSSSALLDFVLAAVAPEVFASSVSTADGADKSAEVALRQEALADISAAYIPPELLFGLRYRYMIASAIRKPYLSVLFSISVADWVAVWRSRPCPAVSTAR
jgi:hypothetical protein